MDVIFENKAHNVCLVTLSIAEWLAIPPFKYFSEGVFDENSLPIWGADSHLASRLQRLKLGKIGDDYIKLNGHSALPSFSQARNDTVVIAEVIELSDSELQSLHETYLTFAKALSQEDDFLKICAAHHIELKSERLKHGLIKEPLNIALRGKPRYLQTRGEYGYQSKIDLKRCIPLFSKELLLLDRLDLCPKIFNTGVLAAAFIALGLGKDIEEFLIRLNREQGVLNDGGAQDPVGALLKYLDDFKKYSPAEQKNMASTVCACALKAMLNWCKGPKSPGYWRKHQLDGADLSIYITELKLIKAIIDEPRRMRKPKR